jgi:iron complex outermembrane receptor protein
MSKARVKPICVHLALAFGGLASTMPAFAQQTAEAPIERVEITGSAIRQIESETALPVQVYKREDIEKFSAKTTEQLIETLPAMQGFTAMSSSVGGGGAGYADANIHSTNAPTIGGSAPAGSHTLVLLNGHRLATSPTQSLNGAGAGFDLNTLPLSAIERIEVLTDGASALYGSDAIGGVINVILRSDYSGISVSAGASNPSQTGGDAYRASVVGGFGNFQTDGYNALIIGSYDRQANLQSSDRNFSSTGSRFFQGTDGKGYNIQQLSANSIPANVATNGTGRFLNPVYGATGKCPAGQFALNSQDAGIAPGTQTDTYCGYNFAKDIQDIPDQKHEAVSGNFKYRVLPEATAYGTAMYTRSEVDSFIAFPPVGGDIIIPFGSTLYNKYFGNPAALPFITPSIQTTDPGQSLAAYYRGVPFGKRSQADITDTFHWVLGAKGTFQDFDYDASYSRTWGQWSEYYTGGFVTASGLNRAIAANVIDPFDPTGAVAPAGQGVINSAVYNAMFQAGTTSLDSIDGKVSRDLIQLPGGPLAFALGGDYRRERNSLNPSLIARGTFDHIAGDETQLVPYSLSRSLYGGFVELDAQVLKQLDFVASDREDHYSDAGNSNTYKFQVRYQPISSLLLRGSYGTGFHAPTVAQVGGPLTEFFGVGNTGHKCPFPAGSPQAAFCLAPSLQWDVYLGANPALRPEKSKQWTAGFRFEPTRDYAAQLDFWNVSVTDAIGQLTEYTIFSDPLGKYRNNIILKTKLSGITNWAIYEPNENLGGVESRGVDLNLKAAAPTPIGKLTFNTVGTWMFHYNYQHFQGSPWASNLGHYEDAAVTLRFQGLASLALDTGPISNQMTMHFKTGYKETGAAGETIIDLATGNAVDPTTVNHHVSSYTTWDWLSQFQASKHVRVSFGVVNLFDRDPPFTIK